MKNQLKFNEVHSTNIPEAKNVIQDILKNFNSGNDSNSKKNEKNSYNLSVRKITIFPDKQKNSKQVKKKNYIPRIISKNYFNFEKTDYLKNLVSKNIKEKKIYKISQLSNKIDDLLGLNNDNIRDYNYTSSAANTYSSPQLPYYVPKNIPLPIIREKLMCETEKLFPERYQKKEIIQDDFTRIYKKNRQLAGQILSRNDSSSNKENNIHKQIVKEKSSVINSGVKPYKKLGNSSVSNVNINNLDAADDVNYSNIGGLGTKISQSDSKSVEAKVSDRHKSHYLQRMKNSPAIKKYKQCMEYSKLPLPNMIKD